MKLKELLDKFDGNTVISIKYGQATVFLEQGLENILDDEDYPCYADVEVETFSIRTSEIIDMAPLLYISLHAESYDVSDNITEYVRSAWSLAAHISKSGLIIAGQSGMDGGNNVIRLPDKTTFKWKSRDGVVRVNCKEHAMKLIEGNTQL